MASKENQEALKHIANVLKIFEENASVDFIRKNEELTTLEDFKILQQAIDDLETEKKSIEMLEEELKKSIELCEKIRQAYHLLAKSYHRYVPCKLEGTQCNGKDCVKCIEGKFVTIVERNQQMS